jgi:BirA family transcriptional regulator, biotin operon repressor / biotin---[acetyl-CoA-carboxylase] ligase
VAPVIHRFDRIESTQDLLHRLAAEGVPAGTAVFAREQSAGRGSRGQQWDSAPGGLWLSVLCRPRDEEANRVLSIRAGLAAARTIETAAGLQGIRLKWPNDLMLRERKLGGILCEGRWSGGRLGWVAVGVGVNVSNRLPPELASSSLALVDVRPGGGLDPEMLLEPLVHALSQLSNVRGLLTPTELAAYATRDWLRRRRLREPAPGIARGITASGELVVQQADGAPVTCRAGHVVLAD